MEVLTGENDALEATSTEAYCIGCEAGLGSPHHDVTLAQPGPVERAEPWRREGFHRLSQPAVRSRGRIRGGLGLPLPLSEEPQELVTNR